MTTPQAGSSLGEPMDVPYKMSFIEGLKDTYQYINCDYLCAICFDTYVYPHVTKCGHTFCYRCISSHLKKFITCPKCSVISNSNELVPDLLLEKIVLKYIRSNKSINNSVPVISNQNNDVNNYENNDVSNDVSNDVNVDIRNILANIDSLSGIYTAIQMLNVRKNSVEENEYIQIIVLLYRFMKRYVQEKEMEILHLQKLVDSLRIDYEYVIKDTASKECLPPDQNINTDEMKLWFEIKHRFMAKNYLNLTQCYFDSRVKQICFGVDKSRPSDIQESTFHEDFEKSIRYQSLKLVATLNYSPDIFNNSNIVSGVEFDKDEEFLALAGVTREVKVYNYDTIIDDVVDIHYPCTEWSSISKVSCLSWNPFYKNMLAWSDYDGAVAFWDVASGKCPKLCYEHERRCWSVDFNNMNPQLLASGSDDGQLKIWSVNLQRPVNTIQTNSNICCVKFNPHNSHDISFGSADYNIYYYDLRMPNEALRVLKGHKKTVSYIKFLDKDNIVSASTDSQLKTWNLSNLYCTRTLTGHRNEKNFVGLATDGDYIACGSENHSLYVYYKNTNKPVFEYIFRPQVGVLNERPRGEQHFNEFISAVTWCRRSNSVIAANSQGIVHVLDLYKDKILYEFPHFSYFSECNR